MTMCNLPERPGAWAEDPNDPNLSPTIRTSDVRAASKRVLCVGKRLPHGAWIGITTIDPAALGAYSVTDAIAAFRFGSPLPGSTALLPISENTERHNGFWVCSKCGKRREHLGNGFADADEKCPGC